jgi:hypothetical protein
VATCSIEVFGLNPLRQGENAVSNLLGPAREGMSVYLCDPMMLMLVPYNAGGM